VRTWDFLSAHTGKQGGQLRLPSSCKRNEREWSWRLLEPAGVHLLVAAFLVAGEVVGEGEADAAVGAHL